MRGRCGNGKQTCVMQKHACIRTSTRSRRGLRLDRIWMLYAIRSATPTSPPHDAVSYMLVACEGISLKNVQHIRSKS
eukprot:6759640-Prymnesium_polylepis.1